METRSKLERISLEILNVGSNAFEIAGLGILATGDYDSGLFYLGLGILGDIGAALHKSAMKYKTSELPLWSKIKYSSFQPYKYLGKEA